MIDATPLLRAYARRRARRIAADPAATQERVLLGLVRRAAGTRFGRAHDFAGIRDVAGFQARVPLRRYEAFWDGWWQPAFPRLVDVSWPGLMPYFAATSGTTSGVTRMIPVSAAMVRANRTGALDLLCHHVLSRPESRVLGGRNFMLGGSTDLVERSPGVCSGDLSGIAAREVPWWARPWFFPPLELALAPDWDRKIAQLARLALRADIRSLGGTPSWLLLFFDRLGALVPDRPKRLASWFPRLELLFHGGVGFAPYAPQFDALLEGSRAETREVYPASEGFIAVADRGRADGLRLILDHGLFYEFVPAAELDRERPARHWIATAETGVDYALVLSTCAGLWGYVLGDTVRLVSLAPPRLVVTGRTSWFLSAFGEHLTGEEIEGAVVAAAAAGGLALDDFAVGPVYPRSPGERGGHLFVVEFAAPAAPAQAAAFAAALDAGLAARNLDYRDHRAGGFGMAPPRVLVMRPGGFAAWMRRRGKLGGQHKVPRVITDPALLDDLARAAGALSPAPESE